MSSVASGEPEDNKPGPNRTAQIGALLVEYLVIAIILQFWLLPGWEAGFSVQERVTSLVAPRVEVQVVHPVNILARPTPQRQAIAIWLAEAPTPTLTPTPPAPTGSPAPAGAAALPTSTAPPIATPAPTPTPAAYLIEIDSSADWPWLVDADGIAVSGRAIITPAPVPATPLIYYVAANAEPCVRPTMLVSVRVSQQGAPPSTPATLAFEMSQESYGAFALRRFLGAVTDLPAIGAVLLAALVAWVIEDARKRGENERQLEAKARVDECRRQCEEKSWESIISYRDLKAEVTKRTDPFDAPDSNERFESLERDLNPDELKWIRELAPYVDREGELANKSKADVAKFTGSIVTAIEQGASDIVEPATSSFARLVGALIEGNKDVLLTSVVSELKNSAEKGRLVWRSPAVRARVESFPAGSRAASASDPSVSADGPKPAGDSPVSADASMAVRRFLVSADALLLLPPRVAFVDPWPKTPPPKKEYYNFLRDDLVLKDNPFGPDRAEEDNRIPGFAYRKFLDIMKEQEPTVLLGADGTGKTATAILLAGSRKSKAKGNAPIATEAKTSRDETAVSNPAADEAAAAKPAATEPAYEIRPYNEAALTVFPVIPDQLGAPFTRQDWLAVIESAFTSFLVRFLAKNDHILLDASTIYRASVLALLLQSYTSVEGVVERLRREGCENDRLFALLRRQAPGEPYHHMGMQQRMDLLAGAIPPDVDCAFIVMDISQGRVPADRLCSNLAPLLSLAGNLAHRRIYLKGFFPCAARLVLANYPWLERRDLAWDVEDLRYMLQVRLNLYGGKDYHLFSGGLDEIFLQQCRLNPRRMIRLGNRILEDWFTQRREPSEESHIMAAAQAIDGRTATGA